METKQTYRRPVRRRKKRSVLGRLVTFLVICLVLFLGVTVFFRVGEIVVEGETRYSDWDVVYVSGVDFGDHMLFINTETAGRQIRYRLPYIDQVEMRRRFPNRLEITVGETVPVAKISFEYGYLILDRDAKILERVEEVPLIRLVYLYGLPEPLLPRPGEILVLGEAARDELAYLRDILNAISAVGLVRDVSRIDMTALYDPEMTVYDGRFTVRLGPNRNLRQRIDMLVYILANLGEDERGTIDMNLERPFFQPEALERPDS